MSYILNKELKIRIQNNEIVIKNNHKLIILDNYCLEIITEILKNTSTKKLVDLVSKKYSKPKNEVSREINKFLNYCLNKKILLRV